MSILKKLKDNNICHAICVANIDSRKNIFENNQGKDYFVIINLYDLKNVNKIWGAGLRFETPEDGKLIVSADFRREDITYFRRNVKKYNKVTHSNDGRVYEVKGFSFKEKYKNYGA